MDKKAAQENGKKDAQPQQMKVRWDNSNMRSIYSNVCNVSGTREEIVFLLPA
jgi:hypothetical protein